MLKAREERRDRTWRYGARIRKAHLRLAHAIGPVDCVCELSAWKFAKGKVLACGCSKRRRGQPKVSKGMCYGLGYREAVIERIKGRRDCRRWLAGDGEHEAAWRAR